jgi:hypothetical protein
VRDNEQSSPVLLHLLQPCCTLFLEFCIAYGQNLINKQNIGIDMDGYGKT